MLEKSYARYEAALHGLERYGMKLRQAEAYVESSRIGMLAERLHSHYERYRLNGDLTAIQSEIAHYEADPWALNHYEDGLLPAKLGEILGELKAGVAGLTLTVSSEPPQQVIAPKGDFLVMDAKYTRETVAN